MDGRLVLAAFQNGDTGQRYTESETIAPNQQKSLFYQPIWNLQNRPTVAGMCQEKEESVADSHSVFIKFLLKNAKVRLQYINPQHWKVYH